MKKSLLLIPLIIMSCKKDPAVADTQRTDSTAVTQKIDSESADDPLRKSDSVINNAAATKEVLRKGVMRNVKDNQIIRTADAEQLPFTLGEEFTKEGQVLVLKITNYNKPAIKAEILTKDKDFNIRINQIKMPNGEFDGPFTQEMTHEVKGKGEVWLMIGQNNMASGNTTGNFTVSVE